MNFYAVAELPLTTLAVLEDLGSAFASTPVWVREFGARHVLARPMAQYDTRNLGDVGCLTLGSLDSAPNIEDERDYFGLDSTRLFPAAFVFAPSGDLRFLPVVGFTYAFAVAGVALMAESISTAGEQVRGWLLPALYAICLAACFFEFLRGYPYYSAFSWDERLEMLTWMDGNLQPGSKVIADPSVLLPNLLAETKQKYRFDLLTKGFLKVTDNRPRFEQAIAAGADYVVVSKSDYEGFFARALSVARVNDQSIDTARQFYSELFKKGTLIWSRDRGPVPYLQPGLEIYRLPKPGDHPGDK